MNGRAAAPPAIECSVGPSTSTEPVASQRAADGLNDLGPLDEPLQHPFAIGQVQVPHPLTQFGIGQAVMLLGGRFDGFAEKMQPLGKDRQLAGRVRLQLSVHADDVSEVDAPHELPIIFSDLIAAGEDLDATTPVLDVQKLQLALVPLQHHASGGPHPRSREFAGSLRCTQSRKPSACPPSVVTTHCVVGRPVLGSATSRRSRAGTATDWPVSVWNSTSAARAQMSPIRARSSNRPPHGSKPRSARRRSFSRRAASNTPERSSPGVRSGCRCGCGIVRMRKFRGKEIRVRRPVSKFPVLEAAHLCLVRAFSRSREPSGTGRRPVSRPPRRGPKRFSG